MRFAILGPLEASGADALAPRHRAVLGCLLLHARKPVSAERLIEAIWGLTPPDTAKSQIHATVAAIRRSLRESGAGEMLRTRPAGYVIDPPALDLDEFTATLKAAAEQADPAQAVATLRSALALWRGEPFADVHAEYVASARTRLTDRRLAAVERLAELELGLGHHEDLVEELAAELAAHPVRERLAGSLMLALYRSGRQADALAVARALRAVLADQHGLDPGKAFTALEQAVLRDDPSLALPALPVAAASPAVPTRAADDHERGHDHERTRADAVAQASAGNHLPYDVPDFTGRDDELAELIGSGRGGMIWAIDGMAGVGKTTLAVHAAYGLAEQCPDGLLFADLHAYTASETPVSPEEALAALLGQLGVAPQLIPSSLHERRALWRARLAARRVLVVLDNVLDAEQVRPLLPGSPDALVIVTSRHRLVDLDGARSISLELLPSPQALELFGRIVGARAEAEPEAVAEVARLCGFLPLAVRIAAARLHHRPQWSVAHLAGRLGGRRRPLSELTTGERGVAAAFALSYRQLHPGHQRMFRLLGAHPGRDIDAYAAAALAEVPPEQAETLLEDLLDAHLLLQQQPDRYTFHDLLREYARSVDAAEDATGPLGRLLDHYLHSTAGAVEQMYPEDAHRSLRADESAPQARAFSDAQQARAWLDDERHNLLSVCGYAALDWPGHTCRLARLLYRYLDERADHAAAVILHGHAVRAARHAGDRAAEVRALVDLDTMESRQGHHAHARENAVEILEAARAIGDLHSEARALCSLGDVYWRQRDDARAAEHYEPALAIYRELGVPRGEAIVLGNLGLVDGPQGHHDQARRRIEDGMQIHRELGVIGGLGTMNTNLGYVRQWAGDPEDAAGFHRRALELFDQIGYSSGQADNHNALGEIARRRDDPSAAFEEHGIALTFAAGNRHEQARAHLGLARAHEARGSHSEAREHARSALELYIDLAAPEAADAGALHARLQASRARS